MKIPRKLKKGLKRALCLKYVDWHSKEVKITSLRDKFHKNSPSYKGVSINGYVLGI